ncbi:hypothetical protein TorRG33x02_135080 [Trema orientale]|uniref:Uncharacterized protein n=1 Tax=Trema orientale TaxID=63057 RepID=A0A2P5EYP2_TREOI|nr:hypothetical protein TorRG33x02_135080 [Trema orientale]
MGVVNEAKTVYCSLIDDDDEGIENPHRNETVASINASEEPISIPIGIPKGLPSYFDWPDVIRSTLHRLNGPSQSRLFKPLTWLEQNLAAHIERYVTPIEIDDKPQRQWKRDGGGAGASTTTKREKKKKQEKEKKEKKARTKLTASQRMDRRLQAIWDNIFEEKPQEKGGADQGMSLKRKKADREGPKEKKARKKQCLVSAAETLRETNDDQPGNESSAAPNSNATRRMKNSTSQISNRLRDRKKEKNNNNNSRSVNLPNDEELVGKKAEEKQYSVTERLNEARRRIMNDLGQKAGENNDKQCSFATAIRLLNQQHNGIVIKQCCSSDAGRVLANQPDNKLVEKKQQYSLLATDQRMKRPDEVTEKRAGKKQQYSSPKGTMNPPNKLSGAAQKAGEEKRTMNTPPNKLSSTAQTAGENKRITTNTPPNKLSGTAQTAGEKKRITMNTPPNKVTEKQNNEANKLLEQKAREKQHSSPATGSLIKNHQLPKKSNWPDQDIIRKAMVQGLALRSQYAKEQQQQQQQQKQLGKTVLPLSTSSKQIIPNRNAVLIKGHNQHHHHRHHHHHQRKQISSRTNFAYNTPSAYHSASYNNPGGTNSRLLAKSSSLNSAPTTNVVDVRGPPIGPVMIKRERPASESLGSKLDLYPYKKKKNQPTEGLTCVNYYQID